jgi:hypothetical protein
LGKEIGVFGTFREQMRCCSIFLLLLNLVEQQETAHHVAYPQIDWKNLGVILLKKF